MTSRRAPPTILLPWFLLLGACERGAEPPADVADARALLSAGALCGSTLAAVDDVDGDGTPDLAVGAPGEASSALLGGAVLLLSGDDLRLLRRLDGRRERAILGSALAVLGDLDGDGCRELALGAPKDPVAGLAAGSIQVVSGRDLTRLWQKPGAAGDHLGAALAPVGDVDGDGHSDLLVGAPAHETGRPGSARLHSGARGALLLALDGARPHDTFGAALAGPGDVDGDGTPDLAVGAPADRASAPWAGRVALFSGRDGAPLWERHGGAAYDALGSSLAAPGDLDGDGVPDVVTGVPSDDEAAQGAGCVLALSGRDGRELWRARGRAPREEFAGHLAPAGDVDGDGRPDVLASTVFAGGERGVVRVLSGRDGSVLGERAGDAPGEGFGLCAIVLPAGDGRARLAAGCPLVDAQRGTVVLRELPGAR